ncbi:MAG: pilus assembly protein TadB [Rhodocyclaceae bacterium]|nr:pilus assembly protein TadB [Rhodocyclaceae bacterium]
MDFLYYLFAVCGFLAVVLALEGLFVIWDTYRGPEAKRIERRLRSVSAGGGSSQETLLLKQRALSELPAVERALMRIPRISGLDRLLQQAGSETTVAMFLASVGLMALIGLLLPALFKLPSFLGIILAAVLAGIPWLILLVGRAARLRKFERQLPEVLDLISRSLRAGHSFPSGLEMVANEGRKPISTEFRTVSDEINFGISVQESLLNLARRIPSTDLSYFVVAVLIQRDTGGNLAELLDNLARLIRQRFQLFEKVRALAAEGKLSGWILGALPFVMAIIINVINPNFMSVLWTDPVGLNLAIGALVFMVLGGFWMWRIVKIRV